MGDLEWAQGIQGVTQGALAGMQLNRQDEELRLKEKALGMEQFKHALESLRKANQDLVQKTGEFNALKGVANPTDEQIKKRDELAAEIQGLLSVVKGGTHITAQFGSPAQRPVPQMAPSSKTIPPVDPPIAPVPPVSAPLTPGALSGQPRDRQGAELESALSRRYPRPTITQNW